MEFVQPRGVIGSSPVRIDGLAKVTGQARFGADHAIPNAALAYLVTAPIACGRILSIDQTAARHLPGVCEIFTYENVGKAVKAGKPLMEGGFMAHAVAPLASPRVYFAGQITAVVVADTFEQAQAAAEAIGFRFKADKGSASLSSSGAKEVKAEALGETELKAGDIDKGFAEAAAIVDAWYETPAQHHNPMELFQCTCAWQPGRNGDELTVWESTQNVRGEQSGLAKQLGIKPSQIHIVSPFIGGAFGSRGELGQFTALVAFAARHIGRPVKLVTTRAQGFTLRTFRAETRHRVRLGANREGQLTALDHSSWELTGRKDTFAVAGSDSTARLYACPNVRTKVVNVEADRQAPGFMRAPPETPYLFAMESAMDELAYKLGIDPLDLRRKNETSVETVTRKPYTSRSLMQCMDHGAELFGWSSRNPEPRSMATAETLIGWGYATAFYPAQAGPADCRITLTPELTAKVEVGTHEIGTGIRTVIAQTASDMLGLPMDAIEVVVGDSSLPAAPMSAGSNSTASVCSAVARACEDLRHRIARAAIDAKSSPFTGLENSVLQLRHGELRSGTRVEPLATAVRRAGRGTSIVQNSSHTPHGIAPLIGAARMRKGRPVFMGGSNVPDRMQFSFGAQFVEVHIDRFTGQLSVPRMVGVYAAGRIMNRRTAGSQLTGGQIWGLSSALHEATELDETLARYVNENLAEYHVPVAADIGEITTVMLDEEDKLINPLGIKGVGELGVTGVNAAIANAVFHASGVRLRKLPIRAGDLTPAQLG